MSNYRKLGRESSQRQAMLRALTTSLIANGKIVTTEARAKEVRKQAEKLIALAVREKDNYEEVTVKAKVARKDADGKRVKEVVDGKKVTVYDEIEKTIKKDKPSRLHARRQMLAYLYPVTEVPAAKAGQKKNTKSVDLASGTIKMHGKEVKIKRSRDAMDAGLGMITEDRRGNGIFGCLSIKDNTGISIYNKHLKAGFILDHPTINKIVDDSIKQLSIKTPSMQQHIENLSGGNQQKVIVSRWLANDPEILIMDEPTRGIDVGAKHEIYEIMEQLADQGKSIIMISSEMPELLGMADRVYVMCNGKITGEIDQKEDMTQEKVMAFATQF